MDQTDLRAVFTILGELGSDVKHILSALDRNQRETEKLRAEFRDETDDIQDRLTKLEKFNVRVLTYASISLPLITAGLIFGKELLFTLLT